MSLGGRGKPPAPENHLFKEPSLERARIMHFRKYYFIRLHRGN